MQISIEQKINCRMMLLKQARKAIYINGLHPAEWETDPEILTIAKIHGIVNELPHIAELAYTGWKGDYQKYIKQSG